MTRPVSLSRPESFPYKQELASALDDGVRCKRMDEPGQLLAGEISGAYQIRLRIAQDPMSRGTAVSADDLAVRDLSMLVNELSASAPDSVLAFYSIGPTKHGFKYHLFEHESDGRFVGCVRGPSSVEA